MKGQEAILLALLPALDLNWDAEEMNDWHIEAQCALLSSKQADQEERLGILVLLMLLTSAQPQEIYSSRLS